MSNITFVDRTPEDWAQVLTSTDSMYIWKYLGEEDGIVAYIEVSREVGITEERIMRGVDPIMDEEKARDILYENVVNLRSRLKYGEDFDGGGVWYRDKVAEWN
jgi:hypothetical protein